MKKALLIIVVSALVAIVKIDSKAQATYRPALLKGSSLIGGNLSFSFGSIETKYSGAFSGKSELSYNSFSFSPRLVFLLRMVSLLVLVPILLHQPIRMRMTIQNQLPPNSLLDQ